MNNELLYRYFSGTATTEEGMAVKQWMEASDENREAFFRERRMFDAMLLTAPDKPKAKHNPLLRRIGTAMIKAAAVAAIVIVAVMLYDNYTRTPDTLAIVSVPAGQRTHITLPDGTAVWLNARSEIRYSTSYNTKRRDVTLMGEAYFSVAKNKEKPFVVHTQGFEVEATGTVFNVQAYPETKFFETALIEGGVNVRSLYIPGKTVQLAAGEKVTCQHGCVMVSRIEHEEDYQWRHGFISFRNERLDGIMRQFERSFGIRINIHNRSVLKHTYTGKFRQNDGVDYALRILQKEINFKYAKDDERETIDIY